MFSACLMETEGMFIPAKQRQKRTDGAQGKDPWLSRSIFAPLQKNNAIPMMTNLRIPCLGESLGNTESPEQLLRQHLLQQLWKKEA